MGKIAFGTRRRAFVCGVAAYALAVTAFGDTPSSIPFHKGAGDPGPRPNPDTVVPRPISGLNQSETALFYESLLRVSELEGTCDTCAQQPQGVPPIDPDPNNPFSPHSLVNSAGMGPVF